MKVEDLDEWQGITADMARAYLERKGWTIYKSSVYQEWHSPGCKRPCSGTIYDRSLSAHKDGEGAHSINVTRATEAIARHEQRPPQAVLRDINPRLRKGVPSEAAQEAHRQNGGIWLATRGELGHGGTIYFVSFYADVGAEAKGPFAVWGIDEWDDTDWDDGYDLTLWSFWPCNAHGNKVRWPERDGVML